ncbi:TAP-like protein [Herbihabitans rhizosphaerae]|uniref:TAP-like protein n=1 Tax=Herbihabitans rhizosphaerae TaxID=1872711 RepID=A0A4Q7L162_9PSEU|nr:alpha/beta hydrolase [Herbihabitans rhizosphaerae]RZS43238.1 TAP-like protein [Herbihabitans rhizosphaerae]
MASKWRSGLRDVAVVTAVVAASAIVGLPQASAAPPPQDVAAEAAVAPVKWGPCAESDLSNVPPADRFRFTCGHYAVPLNHDRPRQGTINIALMRRAANNAGAKIGSLFLNPGGPGGSGYRYPTVGGAIFEPEVMDRFDLIGFDPRGVARSTPLRCFATQEDADAVFGRMALLPRTRAEERSTIDANRDYGQFCKRFAGPLIEHMSTEAVARDLDVLRGAVGDKKLTYVGFSYGTLLGATYANIFPNRSRAIILDGNVDPTLRLLDGLEYDRQRTNGFEIALDAYLKRCDMVDTRCAFSDGDPRAKFDGLIKYLREVGPIAVPNGPTLGHDTFTATVAGNLYNPAALAPLAESMQAMWDVIHPSAASARKAPMAAAKIAGLQQAAKLARYDVRQTNSPDSPYVADDSYAAVNCIDKPFNHRLNEVPGIADEWERQLPTFGRYLAWGDPAVCAAWPLRQPDAYRGPWHARTPNPIMVVGNYYDPATQYEFSRRMASQLGNAFLVSVDSFGHCILGDSSCADKIAARYLIDLQVPGPGTVCHPDVQPFPFVPSGQATREH